jgi:Zn-dependent protease with chaperone function
LVAILQKPIEMKSALSISTRSSVALALLLCSTLAAGQTRITAPPNNYTPAQDVELGVKAAAEARQQLPVMRDDEVTSYVEDIGQRLVAAIPTELRRSEFRYTFEVINVREINAFALPGGPMFVNRGMIEAAHTEGEVAGVMAHELSHVVLRHGTAQASKATKYEIGQVAGAVIGSIIGGGWGQVISTGTQFGLGAGFLRFGREFEQQADLEGAQIMARAGYDPRDMANIFRTIEQQGGSGGPQWLSDHPNPGNRYDYITREAQSLRVENPIRDTRGFEQVRSHLGQLPPAPTTEQATRNARNGQPRGTSGSSGRAPTGRVQPPSNSFRKYDLGRSIRISVPSNWRQMQDNDSVTFAPDGAYGQRNGQNVFTHGVELGISRNESHDLQSATDELLDALAQSNPNMSRPAGYDRVAIGNQGGLRTLLSNTSEITGQRENIEVFTTQLNDGSLLYTIGVAPRDQYSTYSDVFNRIIGSIELRN